MSNPALKMGLRRLALRVHRAGCGDDLDELERKYDQQFAVVFQAIRELMKPPTAKPRELGYHTLVEKT